MLVVTVARNGQIQQHSSQRHAEAALPTTLSGATVRAVGRGEKRLQYLWKEHVIHDADGRAVGKRRDRVGLITIVEVEVADVLDFGLTVARGCGHKTVQDFRDEWQVRHPRSDRAIVIWFALGDWRDRDLFMNWSGRGGGDFTRNARRAMDPDAPVLTREQIETLSSANRQKDDGRRANASAILAAETPSQRLRRLDLVVARYGADARHAIRQELRIIEQRVKRAEKRK